MNKQILSIFVLCAFSYSTQAQEVKGGISDSMMQQIKQSYANTPTDKAIRNAIGSNDIRKLALNQDNLKGMDTHFSIKVPSKGITDQKSSGRCWLFTGLNVMRAKAIAKHNLGSFEFSQTYPFFFDQLEKANLFLQGIIDTSSKPMDDKMVETIESIREHGVLVPALVREKPTGGYEMISGHRRKMASELAGLENIPCIVRNLSDDEAVIVMVDSNLQREEILPSEKAFAYKMKLDVMKRQGQRTDLTSSPLATKLKGKRSDELLGEEVGESKDQIRRYIRLTYLIPEILDMVDNKKIAMRPAVELSYLPKEEQEILYDTMESEDCTPSHAQAIKIRKFSAEGRLNEDVLLSIMSEEKPNQVEQWKIPKNRLEKYFPSGTTQQKMEETIIKALELYRKREKSRER